MSCTPCRPQAANPKPRPRTDIARKRERLLKGLIENQKRFNRLSRFNRVLRTVQYLGRLLNDGKLNHTTLRSTLMRTIRPYQRRYPFGAAALPAVTFRPRG